jgi:hypothetical protein
MTQNPRRCAPVFFFAALALLFLIANRGAYESYFQDDDLDNLSWTHYSPWSTFATGIAAPRYFTGNFRPVGHLYYKVMGRLAGLRYPPFVAVIHALHFLNIIVLWLILKRLRIAPAAAALGVFLFAFHMAVFDAYWRTMYVFDVLCATFCLSAVLLYIKRRWVVGLLFLWLAYKSKEIAVMLPAVLALYEFTLGERRWKLLVPYFAVAVFFGVQGLLRNPNLDNDYTIRFTWPALAATLSFYGPKLIPLGWASLALLLLPFYFPDRRVWFGLGMFALLLFPMLFLPGRLFGAYLYLPLAGIAIAAAALVSRWHWAVALVLIAAWLPWTYSAMRRYRKAELTIGAANKLYVEGLMEARAKAPDARKFMYDGTPEAMHRWGVEGALRLIYKAPIEVRPLEERSRFTSGDVALLTWDPVARKVYTTAGSLDRPNASYITMGPETPVWQLKEGWFPRENRYRWTSPHAKASLYRPPNATRFEIVVNAGPGQMKDLGRVQLTVLLDGSRLGKGEFATASMHKFSWPLPRGAEGPCNVEILTTPEYHTGDDPRTFGSAIVAFGFRE